MSVIEKDFSVFITFDLNYSNSSDYKLVNNYLKEKGFVALSSRGNKMPSNSFVGKLSENIEYEDEDSLTLQAIKSAADKVKKKVYSSIKRSIENSSINITLYVQVSLADITSSSCSKAKDS